MWQREVQNGIAYYTLPHWEAKGAKVIYTSRIGGVSAAPYDSLNLGLHVADDALSVRKNRERVLSLFGCGEKQLISVQQTHTKNIRIVTAADGGRGAFDYESGFPETDGLLTADQHVLLSTFYADCLPIVAFHPGKGVLGMAHSGWKGTYENIGGALVALMVSAYGISPAELWLATGAGIGPCCYRVEKDFYVAFAARYQKAETWFLPHGEGGYFFDNGLAARTLLLEAGVKASHIDVLPICTACDREEFFSYRRDGGSTGRQGLFAFLKEGDSLG